MILSKAVQLLAYADKSDIIGHIKQDVTAAFRAIECEYADMTMKAKPSINCPQVETCSRCQVTAVNYIYLQRRERVGLSWFRC